LSLYRVYVIGNVLITVGPQAYITVRITDIYVIGSLPRVYGIHMGSEPYKSVSIPADLAGEVDKFVGKLGYRSRAEIVIDATRRLLEQLRARKKAA